MLSCGIIRTNDADILKERHESVTSYDLVHIRASQTNVTLGRPEPHRARSPPSQLIQHRLCRIGYWRRIVVTECSALTGR